MPTAAASSPCSAPTAPAKTTLIRILATLLPADVALPWPLVHFRSAGLTEPVRALVLAWDEAGTELLDDRTLRLPAESPAIVGSLRARNASSPRPLLRRTLA